jgi:ketosteroid isomerase-like protein
MMQQGGPAESQIKGAIEGWADAVRRRDLSGILAHHEQDIVMFDVPPPLQSRRMGEYKKTWDMFLRYTKPLQAFDIEELAITAGEDVAFAVVIVRCGSGTFSGPPEEGGFRFRLAIGCATSMANGVSRTSITPCRRQTSGIRFASS